MLKALDRHPQLRHFVHRSVRASERALARLGLDLNRLKVSTTDHPDAFVLEAKPYRGAELASVTAPIARFELEPAGFDNLCARMSRGYSLPGDSLISVENARFDMPSGLVTVRDRLLSDVIPLLYFPHTENLLPSFRVLTRRGRQIPSGALLSLLMSASYYHWLCEILPRAILVAEMVDSDSPLYIGAEMPEFVFESLSLLGLGERLQQLPAGVFKTDRLQLSTFSRAEWPVPSDIRLVRQRLMAAVDVAPKPEGRRILISRSDAIERRVLNEHELAAELDLEPVVLTGMTLAEQIRLFAHADLIVSPHGAGLTNLIFAPEGASVVELITEAHMSPSYLLLASLLHQPYGYVAGYQHGRDITVDIGGVSAVASALRDSQG